MISIEIRIDDALFRRIGRALISPVALGFAALVALAVPIATASPVPIEFSFSANTPARAAEVNANFTAFQAGINDNDLRIEAIEELAPLPSAGQVLAYVTTNANGNEVTSFSSAGAASVDRNNANYTLTLEGVTCADADDNPIGAATVSHNAFGNSTDNFCLIQEMRQDGDVPENCEIVVRCFDGQNLETAGWNLIYVQ
jgi:hypothetical protein